MKSYITIYILIIITVFPSFAQAQTSMTQEEENMVKYWYYRNRLQYFMVQGNNSGESQVAGIRNYGNTGALHFGQHSAYLGDYFGVLATEYYLLNHDGQDVNQTLLELYYAMETYIENMDKCEADYPWESLNMSDQYDGFFMRNNVPNDFVSTHPELNKNVLPEANHSGGDPGWVNSVEGNIDPTNLTNTLKEVISQDEAIFLLQGLALIAHLVPNNKTFYDENNNQINYSFRFKSQQIAGRIISFIQDCPYWDVWIFQNPVPWWFFRPDNKPMAGNYAGFFQEGFRKTDKFFSGTYFGETSEIMYYLWNSLQFTASIELEIGDVVIGNPDDAAHMVSSLAAICDCWQTGIVIKIPGTNIVIGQIGINTTQSGLKFITTRHEYNWDTFYLMLWGILNFKEPDKLNIQKVRDQLNAAPCNGPYAESDAVFSGNGWACSAKFWHNNFNQENGDYNFLGMYNGLDYMLLYNLYRITCATNNSIPDVNVTYKNYFVTQLSNQVNTAQNFIVMRSIVSSQTIMPTSGPVKYQAGESIELVPGFNTADNANFEARISQVACDDNIINNQNVAKSPLAQAQPADDTVGNFIMGCIPGLNDTIQFDGIDFDTTDLFSYSWYFPSPAQILSGQSTRNPVVIFPTCNYNYELCSMAFTDSIGETNRVFFNIYKECCDSLELKNGTAPVNAYPNPNDGLFSLNSTETGVNYTLEVYNIFGELVYTGTSANGEAIINIKGTAPGLYMIKLFIDDGREQVLKILIK